MAKHILWFNEIGIKDVPKVGGKNASLGEMYRNLKKDVKVPNGFAVTADAYRHFIHESGLADKISAILKKLNVNSMPALQKAGSTIRTMIKNATIPKDLKTDIEIAYDKLCKEAKIKNLDVAVRSSATAEDLPDASFAGQQESYLGVKGKQELLLRCKECFASLFTNRAISYRVTKGFSHDDVALSIAVQRMVRSDSGTSGVMFSIDTESGFKDVVFISAAYGLGENVVQGMVNPDEIYVHKPTLMKGFKSIVSKKVGSKELRRIYAAKGTKDVNVTKADQEKFCIDDKDTLTLAKWACAIEKHYKKPMDIEWAKDGKTGELFIVQARPETVASRKDANTYEEYKIQKRGKIVAQGKSVGSKIGQGKANIIKNVKDINKFKKGQVLVTEITDPDWEPIMKIASAIVTNRGGRTCHAAIISRELGIPCIVGTATGTETIKNGKDITVSCAEGEDGFVYDGKMPFKVNTTNLKTLPKTKTKIMMNLGNPEQAFGLASIPNDGIGLAREEFIINNHIGIHPLALRDYAKLKDKKVKAEIAKRTVGYTNKEEFFIDKLAEGIAVLAASVYPKDIIVRMSDFKSNEYANLLGGHLYEPKEENPMIGFRGASRYYSDMFKDAFALECKALTKAREVMGLNNIKVMIPFCRTPAEGKNVLKIMKDNRLVRGKNNLQVYVMCEIPSNVLLAEEYCKLFDGFSIGSNDLTQLTLGLDRDGDLVAHIFDERNEAVKMLIRQVIKVAKKHKKKIGICGDAPSTYMEFAQFLVEEKIDSMSLTPDAIVKTKMMVGQVESGKKGKSTKKKTSKKRR